MNIDKNIHRTHISKQFNESLDNIINGLLDMGNLARTQLKSAVQALLEENRELAETVNANDREVDAMEVAIDNECTEIIVRRQPAASDLRLILAVARSSRDLERIGDEAAKVARRALSLMEEGRPVVGYSEVRQLADLVLSMLDTALLAFSDFDADTALRVMHQDKDVDAEYKRAMRSLVMHMMEDPRCISQTLNIIWILRALERIGDHAENIAEYVIYLAKGMDVRHKSLKKIEKELSKQQSKSDSHEKP
ncbi:phosphate signaling complex protein PhoU [Desulfurispirillum indicum]|uniref:Phosphate-specific transport system accessory protein PhoU n=1 Tax=Desulfurispirillum indicum (strain ATCC BAA-1389 / DSM 22839 / S5) TaxID=653733 RepID=E6W6G2_DESIS|nr:phosphate signaling complex protein PhoU [Desulfurispirillum indicum]ADU67297.1 phosphate transport system regulatory protein PhoU [Desulfurispirillum indicum S5]UCZ56669.1 phosphate signaling complex protein PhoU [Desulfurispirillum indicum]